MEGRKRWRGKSSLFNSARLWRGERERQSEVSGYTDKQTDRQTDRFQISSSIQKYKKLMYAPNPLTIRQNVRDGVGGWTEASLVLGLKFEEILGVGPQICDGVVEVVSLDTVHHPRLVRQVGVVRVENHVTCSRARTLSVAVFCSQLCLHG